MAELLRLKVYIFSLILSVLGQLVRASLIGANGLSAGAFAAELLEAVAGCECHLNLISG